MRYTFNTIFIIILISCSGSKKITLNPTNQAHIDWSENSFLKPYIDSLKMIKINNIIPKFLSNDCFDYDNKFYWSPKHNPKSFRKQIIFSIKNIEILKFLIENKNEISTEICKEKLEHPYGGEPNKMDSQDVTNLQLVKLRMVELE